MGIYLKMTRRYEFDHIRVYAILLVFAYHSTRFFNLSDWHVKNVTNYARVEGWTVFVLTWLMPLFFTISGASLFFAGKYSKGFFRFFRTKFLRLMIPVIVACVSHGAMQVYFERLSHGLFAGSFFDFRPHYFNGIYHGIGEQGNFAFIGMHLWYLLFLFVYTLLCYPLFSLLSKKESRLKRIVTTVPALPGMMYLLLPLPLILIRLIVPQGILNAGAGGWGFIYYIFFLVSGFLIVSSRPLEETIKKSWIVSLLLGIIASGAYHFLLFSSTTTYSVVRVDSLPASIAYFFSAWCWILAILGGGMRFLAEDTSWLTRANEGVLPFYILHQSVLVAVGYFVMQLQIPDIFKWIVVFILSFMIIIALYKIFIQRFDLFRFLFGMKTSSPLLTPLIKNVTVAASTVFFISLIAFAIHTQKASQHAMPMAFSPDTDIILDYRTISASSAEGVALIDDPETASGRAIEFTDNESSQALSSPKTFVKISFKAPAGNYTLWLRGKSDKGVWSDSVWLQVDNQIKTGRGSLQMGNWQSIHPVGTYGWAGNSNNPAKIYLTYDGTHTLLIQPRQVPHCIDQIWLSKNQARIPDTRHPIRQ